MFLIKLAIMAALGALPSLPAATVRTADTCEFRPMDAIDTHIDVSAQKHIMRALSSSDATEATQALGMLSAVKSGALAGVFLPARGPVVERGKKMSPDSPKPWWTMIPEGKLATCLTEPASEPPMIVYKQNLQPAQLTTALSEAWSECGLPVEPACFTIATRASSLSPLPLAQTWRGVTTSLATVHLTRLIEAHDAKKKPPSQIAKAVERWIGVGPKDAKWRSALETLRTTIAKNSAQTGVTVDMPPSSDSWPGCKQGFYAENKDDTIHVCRLATKSQTCLQNVLTHEYFHSVGMPAEGTQGVERGGICSPPGNLDAAMKASACLTGLACEMVWGKGKACSAPC